jgi:hypothetical protein
MAWQLAAGGAVSLLNFVIHAVMSALIMVGTRHTAVATDEFHFVIRLIALLMVTVAVLSVAHLAEIVIWAGLFGLVGLDPGKGISTFEMAFENYTALGYGDVVPPPGLRLFGPMAALNGLLLIGWSVFILFDVMRMAEVQIGRGDRNV